MGRGDIRYNVLRWTSSPNPPFSGYGPSFTNPRTGQIIGADIMLEFAGVTRRVQYQRILETWTAQQCPIITSPTIARLVMSCTWARLSADLPSTPCNWDPLRKSNWFTSFWST
ncbi:MAG: hypothetical protein CM1200mP36_00300 [Gammaproteobacteria bacterium]|nr:MAG: hypothetical protein CM1200mP36_00300 [Gammaproteobacteria bacterium]